MSPFSLFIGIGAAAGLVGILLRFPRRIAIHYLHAATWTLWGGLIGGRLGHVILAWPYFRTHLNETTDIWLGGFSAAGAAWGSVLALCLTALLNRAPLGVLAQGLLPLAMGLGVTAWLAWGLPSGVLAPAGSHWAVQLVGALAVLGSFAILDWMRGATLLTPMLGQKKNAASPMVVSNLMLAVAGVEVTALGLFWGEPMVSWRGVQYEAWGGLAMLAAALLGLGAALARSRTGLENKSETNAESTK